MGHFIITANSIEKAKTSQPLLQELVEQCKEWNDFVESELEPQNELENQELGGPLPHDDLLDDDFDQQFQDFEQDDDDDFNEDDYMKGDTDSDDSDDEIIRRKSYSDSDDSDSDDETMVRRTTVSDDKNVQKELLDNNIASSFALWSISNDPIINEEF